MALEIQSRHAVVQGTPLVQPSDEHFWFGRPQLILSLIHFTLFQNAFEVAFFCFIWYQFGLKSCFNENFGFFITRFAMGVGVQFLCSYITLPLYALVTQMGSNMKKAIFDEQTSNAVKRWHQAAKRNRKQNKRSGIFSGFKSGETSNQGSSPAHLLHRYKTVGYLDRRRPAERLYHSDYEMSDLEMDEPLSSPSTTEGKENTEAMGQATSRIYEGTDNTDFSFAKL
jgi:mlo protein